VIYPAPKAADDNYVVAGVVIVGDMAEAFVKIGTVLAGFLDDGHVLRLIVCADVRIEGVEIPQDHIGMPGVIIGITGRDMSVVKTVGASVSANSEASCAETVSSGGLKEGRERKTYT
jgi:hypothetical protein